MKQKHQHKKGMLTQLRGWLLVMMLTIPALQMQADDWVLNESKYNAVMEDDHLHLEAFIADLDRTNTYSKGGFIYASNGLTTIKLLYLEYINDGDDETQTAQVKAYLCEPNAKAWFTNSMVGEQEIGTSMSTFWLTKWGGDHHYMTTKINYYYPAELVGTGWKIYYQFRHSKGKDYTKVLKNGMTINASLGLTNVDGSKYTVERNGPDNIKFKVPRLPDDIPSKLGDARKRFCTYYVDVTYFKQDGSPVIKSDTIECDKNQEKVADIAIPEEAGNPKRTDLRVVVRQGVRDGGGNEYYSVSNEYAKNNVLRTVPAPRDIAVEYRQFDQAADLMWSTPAEDDGLVCIPYVYRMETDAHGQAMSSASWTKRGSLDNAVSSSSLSFKDDNVQLGKNYKYMVLNVPKDWMNKGISTSQLNSPAESLLNRLGYGESGMVAAVPSMSIYMLRQDTAVTDKVKLLWEYSRVPTSASTVEFKVLRKTSENSDWTVFGSVNGESQPNAGTMLSIYDETLPDRATRYQYKVRLSLADDQYQFESAPVSAGLLEGSRVKTFEATKGTHNATVRLTWTAKHVGTNNTTYVISRRYVNSDDDFMNINTTNGTAEQYTYEDNTVQPGYYYEYKVETYSSGVLQNALGDVGFCQARGVISGRVTLSNGSSVEEVRMNLHPSDTGDDNTVRGYAQRVDGLSTGIAWEASDAALGKVFGSGKNYTVQLFVRPDGGMNEGAVICSIPGEGLLTIGGATTDGYELKISQTPPSDGDVQGNTGPLVATGLSLPQDIYSLITVSKNGNALSVRVNDGETKTIEAAALAKLAAFSVGGARGFATQIFKGNFTEVRVWNHELSQKEQAACADRILNGREQGLLLYWPMDEGQDRCVFDASYANDLPNGRHATVGANIQSSAIIPTDKQLARYAVTNANGEFIIRGIPFVGSGSTYTLVPTKGIHEFNPLSRNGFIGNGNLTLNSYDFTDVSSFPVRGKITYLNTNIPVDSVQFMIDGTLLQSKEGVHSDANGEYEIQVPIGEHLMECYLNGHRFTSFPMDGSKHNFKRAETVNFVDSTLVNVTGRINGGYSDQDAPLGFNCSQNRLGKATIKLSLGKESQCSFNYIVDEHGDGHFGTANIPVESATDSIKSVSYRAGGSHDETHFVYITTDEKTGEFSAMLPPLKYKVESIKFNGGTDYDDLPVFKQNLPVIDATNAVKENMRSDSLVVGDVHRLYTYSAKMIRQYRATPELTVKQKDTKNGAFGDMKVEVNTLQNERDSLQVINYTETGYSYLFGYPVFVQNKTYSFDINVAEIYRNLDTKATFREIPRDAIVSINNDASVLSSVTAEKAHVDGKEEEAGMAVESFFIHIIPDSAGHVDYSFIGGWPNMGNGHLRNMSVSVTVDRRTTTWKAPGSNTDALDLILLGSLPTGSNFMTQGPDKVDYILRRPPGSTSVASFENTTITAHNKSIVKVESNSSNVGAYISLTPTFEIGTGAGLGAILITNSKWKLVTETTVTDLDGTSDEKYLTDNRSYTLSEKTTTPKEMPYSNKYGEFHPENGDTYVGHATNLTFSKARMLGLFQQNDGSYKLDEKDGIAMGESFGTSFIYTQQHIEDILIPNWKKLIASKLIHVDGNHWDENNPQVKRVPGEVRYYTSYNPEDKEYGLANGDDMFASLNNERKGWNSYRMVNGMDELCDDEIENAANQISCWESTLASNENDKLKAFADNSYLIGNYSISGGTSYGQTEVHGTTKSDNGGRHKTTHGLNTESKLGSLINSAGFVGIVKTEYRDSETTDSATVNTNTQTVSWSMSDADTRTALSVDVYKSPQGWGPIFRTRSGRTANPYEGETRTAYIKKGSESEKLNEATMRVEKPSLKLVGAAELTDVPTGGEAKFTLQLTNDSETSDLCVYALRMIDSSNPNGAILMMDGTPLSNGSQGRSFKINANETIEKTLIVKQSDPSIIDYNDIRLVLMSSQDFTVSSDPVRLRVHFVPSSTRVDLSVDHTVVNKAFIDDDGGITATMSGLNRQDEGLKGLRLRYRRKGTDTWTVIKQWSDVADLQQQGYLPMPEGSTIKEKVAFLGDGRYELQAQTFGMYGTEEVTYESNVIEVTQDTHGPKILGMVSHENGILTYSDHNNMHLRFNESLNENALSKSDNFRIEGGMNNVLFGEGKFPDVAVQLNGDRIETDAIYDLSNNNYAFDMWFYRQGDGTIISMGTDNNMLALATRDDGDLYARIGQRYDLTRTGTRLPKNKWIYLAMSYKHKANEDDDNLMTMLYVTDEDTQVNYICRDLAVEDLSSHGKFAVGGNGMQGMISGVSIWNSNITAYDLYESRNKARAAYTPGLVGYWRMDEGHGTVVTDVARSRHMHMESESWYINNENLAAHLDEDHHMPIDIATFNPSETDNYAIEMWFRGSEEDNAQQATLFSVMNGLKVGYDAGKIKLQVVNQQVNPDKTVTTTVKEDYVLSEKSYLDNNWHHFALNVRRGTSAVAYIDGEAVKVLPENIIPGLSDNYLQIGGWENAESHQIGQVFKGDVDEVRIWGAALDGKLVKDRMYERMDDGYPGLVGYFPMEEISRTPQGNVTTKFSNKNYGEKNSRLNIATELKESSNAPALKPGSSKMRLDDSQFEFTASGDEIYFSFPDAALPLMDNNDFVATVNYIKDEHGNNSEVAMWKFHTDFASLSWKTDEVRLTKAWNESLEWQAYVINQGEFSQSYEITGMPSWLTVEKSTGTITGDGTYINFKVDKNVPIGHYTENIYLTDRLGIRRVLTLKLTVQGDEPDWTVDTSLYDCTMTMTGQIVIDGKICELTDTKIAAFDNLGQCRGVASPRYVESRDAYYVDMVIYGHSEPNASVPEDSITFKLYDSSTGNTYPFIFLTLPGEEEEAWLGWLVFKSDVNYGNYDAPVVFEMFPLISQPISLEKGWSWMSIYVIPWNPLDDSEGINSVLGVNITPKERFKNIKSKTAFSSMNSEGEWIGEVKFIIPGQMYKIQMLEKADFMVTGYPINTSMFTQTIAPGYNWIGTLASKVMSVDEAFAELEPQPGDRVKNRTSFAEFSSKGYWEGTLTAIVPGHGYIYHSLADKEKEFHYPKHTWASPVAARSFRAAPSDSLHFTPVDDSQFPDNMSVLAVVKKDGVNIDNAEVGAFINGECRGAISCNRGYYFLTILGSTGEDDGKEITIKVYVDGEEYVVPNNLKFSSDRFYGSLDNPYVIDVNTSGIRVIDSDTADDDADWMTLQGFKLSRKPTKSGVYIHRGKKVMITKKR